MDKWQDNTTAGVLYPTDVRNWVLNIDSRFRDVAQSTSSTDFFIRLPRAYKNVISIRLTSIELPNTWYAFSCKHGETAIQINNHIVTISDGNYDPTSLATIVESSIQNISSLSQAAVNFDSNSGKITINNSGTPFTMTLGSASTCGSNCSGLPVQSSYNPYNGGLGYLMGFTGTSYSGNSTYTGEYIVDTLRDNYVLLQLPELEMMMDSYSYGNTSIKAFAKIIVDVEKNALIYNNAGDLITRAISFPQPTNVTGFRVKLVDAYGEQIDLMANFSFTVEIQEILNSKTYEAYRNHLTGN
jgi:hypothetical protein